MKQKLLNWITFSRAKKVIKITGIMFSISTIVFCYLLFGITVLGGIAMLIGLFLQTLILVKVIGNINEIEYEAGQRKSSEQG